MTQTAVNQAQSSNIPMWLKVVSFVMPQIGMTLLYGPVIAVLGGFYAKYYGLSLTSIATVILAARIFDAITDPLIGYYSDRWRLKTGSRKPLILVGALLLSPSAYFLFVPPSNVSALYFALWYMTFYLGLTLFMIPYMAWAHEFTETSKDKAMVFSAINIAGQTGGALFYVLPLLPFFITTDISPEVLKATVYVGTSLFLPGLYLAFKFVPDGLVHEAPATDVKNPTSLFQQAWQTIQELINNRPFLLFVWMFIFSGLAFGLWLGLLFIFVDAYLNLGEEFAQMSLWGMVCGALAIPFWYRIVVRWGKRIPWLVGAAVLLMIFVATGFLEPSYSGYLSILVLYLSFTFFAASAAVVGGPMLCDIIDYGCYQTGHERSGVYFAMQGLMLKIQLAIGGALGLAIIGGLGFDMNAATHSATSVLGLKISISWLPVLLMIPAMVCIYRIPLSEHRMTIIRRRLARRAA
ncbi:putative symporter YjmB [Gammaproteobacteria bacterium MOLA455]|nr:putative symporter YjmB [Gammaproteobacteria bacterium MOLA455]